MLIYIFRYQISLCYILLFVHHKVEVWWAQSAPPNRESETSPQAAVSSLTACQDRNIHMHSHPGPGQNMSSYIGGQCLDKSAEQ